MKKQAKKVVADDYKLLTYLIFDAPSHGGKYEDRVKWLQANVPQDDEKCYATVVGIKKCQGLADLKQCLADVNKADGEGIMLRKPGSLYENKRSSTLLKVKTFYDEGKSPSNLLAEARVLLSRSSGGRPQTRQRQLHWNARCSRMSIT